MHDVDLYHATQAGLAALVLWLLLLLLLELWYLLCLVVQSFLDPVAFRVLVLLVILGYRGVGV